MRYLKGAGANIKVIEDIDRHWRTVTKGLSPTVIAVYTIVTTCMTGGATAPNMWVAMQIGALRCAEILLVNNVINRDGNIFKAVGDMFRSENLKKIAVAGAAAGLGHEIMDRLGLLPPADADAGANAVVGGAQAGQAVAEGAKAAQQAAAGVNYLVEAKKVLATLLTQIPIEMAFEGKSLAETLKGTIRMAAGALMASVATTHASGWHDKGLTGDLLHTTLNVTIGAMSSAVSGGDVACGALGALMAQYAGKALKAHFGKDLTDRQMIAIVQSGAAIFAGMLGKNPSEAAAAALVVMECDILRARGPSAEEIAEEERKKEEARHQAEEEQAASEEAARLEKRRLQDEEIARQNEKLRIDKEKLAVQEQERAAAQKLAAEEAARQPQVSYTQDDYRDMVNEAYGINPTPVALPEDPRAQVQNQLQELGLGDDFGMEPGYHYAGHSPVVEEHKKRIAEVDVVSLVKQGGKNVIDWLVDQGVDVARQKGMGHRPRSHSANARMAGRVDAVNEGADKALAHVAPDHAGPQEKANRLRQISQARHDEARRFKERPWECVDMMHPYAAQALGEAAAPVVMPVIEVAADVVNVAGDLGVHAVGAVVRGGAELDGYNKNVAKGVAGVAEKGVEIGLFFGALGVRQGAKAMGALKKAERAAGGLEMGAAGRHLAQKGHHAGDIVEHVGKAFPQGAKKVKNETPYNRLANKAGRIFGPGLVEAHHLISPKNKIVAEHRLWDLAGVDKDGLQNLMLLPTPKGAVALGNKKPIHKGRHGDEVHKAIRKQMDKAERLGELNGWQKHQYAEAMRRIMGAERKALLKGERALGKKNARPGEKMDLQLEVNFEGI
jgi:hypothetical protein